MDTLLSSFFQKPLFFKFSGADISQVRMPSSAVVKHFDVVADIFFSFISGFVLCKKYSLGFQAAKETLCHGIVPAVSLAAHTANDTKRIQYFLKVITTNTGCHDLSDE